MKRVNILFLLTLFLSMVGTKGFAHDIEVANSDGVTIYYNWTNNNTELQVTYRGNAYNSFEEYSGVVLIPATITYNNSPYPVTSIGNYAFRNCSNLTNVDIPNSVTSIGNYAFSNCSNLTNVDIPNSVTSIGDSAFEQCTGLTSVNIPNSVGYIGGGAFEECTSLASINIPNSVIRIYSCTFRKCTSLTSVTIHSNIIEIGQWAFAVCTGLTSVIVERSVTNYYSIHYYSSDAFAATNIPVLYVPTGCSGSYRGKWSENFSQIVEMGGVVLTANSYTRLYGESNPAFGYTSAGEAALTGTPDITCAATATSPVGIYPIVISKGSVLNPDDYYVNGTLTIEKAPLTIAANSYTITQGDALPTFDVTYTGFKNGEDESVLTVQPTISCTAADSNTPGEYTVTVSGAQAQNYEIEHYDGILTVNVPNAITIKMATNSGNAREAIGYSSEYSLDFTSVTDVKAYVATGFTDDGDVLLSRIYVVPANTGVYFKSVAGAGIEVTVPTTDKYVLYANLLKPYIGTGTLASSETIDGVTYKNYVVGTKNGKPSFAIWGGGTFGPHKAYMPIPESLVPAAAARAGVFSVVFIDDESTGIDELTKYEAPASDALYDLQGRKVSNAKRGIYVRNGKKIFIK